MNDFTTPAQVATMSVSELAALTPERKHAIDLALQAATGILEKAWANFDAAVAQSYADRVQAERGLIGKDFGVVHVRDGALRVSVDVPKRVTWDQKLLGSIARSITGAGERIEDYMEVQYSVSESRFNNWPPALREQFAAARTVKPGKPAYRLTMED